MTEKTIVESKLIKGVVIVISAFFMLVGLMLINYAYGMAVSWRSYSYYGRSGKSDILGNLPYTFVEALPVSGPGIFAILAGILIYWCFCKEHLVVTNKRVYGKVAFGKRVDLPLDMITAVGTSLFKCVAVTTASGSLKFRFIQNRDEIYNEISKLLLDRQGKSASPMQELPQSNAEELKRFKDLLDSGVITQEEFVAKKKQLLRL